MGTDIYIRNGDDLIVLPAALPGRSMLDSNKIPRNFTLGLRPSDELSLPFDPAARQLLNGLTGKAVCLAVCFADGANSAELDGDGRIALPSNRTSVTFCAQIVRIRTKRFKDGRRECKITLRTDGSMTIRFKDGTVHVY